MPSSQDPPLVRRQLPDGDGTEDDGVDAIRQCAVKSPTTWLMTPRLRLFTASFSR